MLLLILYLFTTIAESDGVGENRLQFTINMSMSLGFVPVLSNKESIKEKITSSASPLADSMVGVGGMKCIAGGKHVSSPRPDLMQGNV